MANKIFFPPQPIQPIKPQKNATNTKTTAANNTSFAQVLDRQLNPELKFSNHAQERLRTRNIEFSATDMEKLNDAVAKAREKGARDSLVLMQDLALVVSVKNNTVITAVDGDSLKENVFTNIDSAVII